jgi:hypothetical protein
MPVRRRRVMIATQASPGQATLLISPDKAPPGMMAMVILRNRKTGEGLKYTSSDEWLPTILGWNKSDPPAIFDAAMAAEGLFRSDQHHEAHAVAARCDAPFCVPLLPYPNANPCSQVHLSVVNSQSFRKLL